MRNLPPARPHLFLAIALGVAAVAVSGPAFSGTAAVEGIRHSPLAVPAHAAPAGSVSRTLADPTPDALEAHLGKQVRIEANLLAVRAPWSERAPTTLQLATSTGEALAAVFWASDADSGAIPVAFGADGPARLRFDAVVQEWRGRVELRIVDPGTIQTLGPATALARQSPPASPFAAIDAATPRPLDEAALLHHLEAGEPAAIVVRCPGATGGERASAESLPAELPVYEVNHPDLIWYPALQSLGLKKETCVLVVRGGRVERWRAMESPTADAVTKVP